VGGGAALGRTPAPGPAAAALSAARVEAYNEWAAEEVARQGGEGGAQEGLLEGGFEIIEAADGAGGGGGGGGGGPPAAADPAVAAAAAMVAATAAAAAAAAGAAAAAAQAVADEGDAEMAELAADEAAEEAEALAAVAAVQAAVDAERAVEAAEVAAAAGALLVDATMADGEDDDDSEEDGGGEAAVVIAAAGAAPDPEGGGGDDEEEEEDDEEEEEGDSSGSDSDEVGSSGEGGSGSDSESAGAEAPPADPATLSVYDRAVWAAAAALEADPLGRPRVAGPLAAAVLCALLELREASPTSGNIYVVNRLLARGESALRRLRAVTGREGDPRGEGADADAARARRAAQISGDLGRLPAADAAALWVQLAHFAAGGGAHFWPAADRAMNRRADAGGRSAPPEGLLACAARLAGAPPLAAASATHLVPLAVFASAFGRAGSAIFAAVLRGAGAGMDPSDRYLEAGTRAHDEGGLPAYAHALFHRDGDGDDDDGVSDDGMSDDDGDGGGGRPPPDLRDADGVMPGGSDLELEAVRLALLAPLAAAAAGAPPPLRTAPVNRPGHGDGLRDAYASVSSSQVGCYHGALWAAVAHGVAATEALSRAGAPADGDAPAGGAAAMAAIAAARGRALAALAALAVEAPMHEKPYALTRTLRSHCAGLAFVLEWAARALDGAAADGGALYAAALDGVPVAAPPVGVLGAAPPALDAEALHQQGAARRGAVGWTLRLGPAVAQWCAGRRAAAATRSARSAAPCAAPPAAAAAAPSPPPFLPVLPRAGATCWPTPLRCWSS